MDSVLLCTEVVARRPRVTKTWVRLCYPWCLDLQIRFLFYALRQWYMMELRQLNLMMTIATGPEGVEKLGRRVVVR